MRRSLWLVLALLPSVATFADDSDDSDDEEIAEPRVLYAGGRLQGARAKLTLRYLVSFREGTSQRMSLDLMGDMHVTNATVRYGTTAHPLRLLRAEAASDALASLVELPAGPTRRWALAITRSDDNIEVEMAAPRAGSLTLELEVDASTCLYRDVRYTRIPEDWAPVVEPGRRAHPVDPAALGEACEGSSDWSDATWMAFPSPELANRPAGPARVGATGGRVALGNTHVAKVELAVAGTLGEVPRDLATVFVVDASLSMTAAELDAQRELVTAYARATPNARVQIIAYDRRARALLPSWSVTSQANLRIDRELRGLALHNGSNFDVGLAEAGRWLDRTTGTKRIVLFTDERVANRLLDAAPEIARRVATGTLVHVVAASEHDDEPTRDDEVLLAPIANATGGISVRSGQPEQLDPTLVLRPITLDHVELVTPGWTKLAPNAVDACGDTLAEGHACTWWGKGDRRAGPITIEGMVWGTKVTRVVPPDRSAGTSVARELSTMQDIDETLLADAREVARSVNARWSLYVEWGGHHGYPEDTQIIGGICGCDTGSMTGGFGTVGHAIRHAAGTPPPLDLHRQLAAAVDRCGLGDHAVAATVETTKSEIVDVALAFESAPSDARRARELEQCVTDAIWNTTLAIPAEFPHRTTRVAFGG